MTATDRIALRVRDLSVGHRLQGIDLDLREGEVVGVGGLQGHGQRQLFQALFGVGKSKGAVDLWGRPLHARSPRQALADGIALVPEDRRAQGLLLAKPVRENLTLSIIPRFSRGGFLDGRKEKALVAEMALRRRVLTNLKAADASFAALREHMAEAAEVRVSLDTPEIALAASEGLRRLIDRVATSGDGPAGLDLAALDTVARAADVASRMKSSVDLWFAQNAIWRLLDRLPELRRLGQAGDARALQALVDLERLARSLRLAVPGDSSRV